MVLEFFCLVLEKSWKVLEFIYEKCADTLHWCVLYNFCNNLFAVVSPIVIQILSCIYLQALLKALPDSDCSQDLNIAHSSHELSFTLFGTKQFKILSLFCAQTLHSSLS